jgi:hypothetical protein
MGGYGMNMGIGDAVDLGWKLAAVLNGWGHENLLGSYECERRPIHQRVIDEAASNYAKNSNSYKHPELEASGPAGEALRQDLGRRIREEKAREFASVGIQLGYRYENSPIVYSDGSAPTADEVGVYEPTARPGHLAPHAWIDTSHCIYDLLGPDFTLLVLGNAESEVDRFRSAATAAGVPLRVVTPGLAGLREQYGADLVLVRPDQHVAWRGRAADPGQVLALVTGVPARGAVSVGAARAAE